MWICSWWHCHTVKPNEFGISHVSEIFSLGFPTIFDLSKHHCSVRNKNAYQDNHKESGKNGEIGNINSGVYYVNSKSSIENGKLLPSLSSWLYFTHGANVVYNDFCLLFFFCNQVQYPLLLTKCTRFHYLIPLKKQIWLVQGFV